LFAPRKSEKAVLVGAKTVKGPDAESASTNPASLTAATSVEKLGLAEATSTIVLLVMTGSSSSLQEEKIRTDPIAARRENDLHRLNFGLFIIVNLV
jgi:hypothetical protein